MHFCSFCCCILNRNEGLGVSGANGCFGATFRSLGNAPRKIEERLGSDGLPVLGWVWCFVSLGLKETENGNVSSSTRYVSWS